MKSVKYRKVLNVLSYVFVGIAFTLSLVGIIIRFNKGTVYTHEEYGAFENFKLKNENKNDIENCIFSNYGYDCEINIKNENIVVCGLAGDFCVMESIKNLMKHWKFNLEILISGIASIDGGEKLKNFIKENNYKTVN